MFSNSEGGEEWTNTNPDSFHGFAPVLHQKCESCYSLSFSFNTRIVMCLIVSINEAHTQLLVGELGVYSWEYVQRKRKNTWSYSKTQKFYKDDAGGHEEVSW